jgi:hypothetical protein
MNDSYRRALSLTLRTIVAIVIGGSAVAQAAPGAHGPDGEHLDQKGTSATRVGAPRLDANSETFELVGALDGGALTLLIDRYETNEPVLGATLELESGPHKAVATYRAESGDYVVNDGPLLKALAAPGEHALVFTLTAGSEVDLLNGTLVVSSGTTRRGPGGVTSPLKQAVDRMQTPWVGAGVAALALVGLVGLWVRRRNNRPADPAGEVRA